GWPFAMMSQPFRQVLMKVLRLSPVNCCELALALQSFIFCCCGVSSLAGAAVSPFRQLLMYALRSSPFLPSADLLQSAMRCCCGVGVFAGVDAAGVWASAALAKQAVTRKAEAN